MLFSRGKTFTLPARAEYFMFSRWPCGWSSLSATMRIKQYIGEIKNELFFKNEARNLTFWTTPPIRVGDSSN